MPTRKPVARTPARPKPAARKPAKSTPSKPAKPTHPRLPPRADARWHRRVLRKRSEAEPLLAAFRAALTAAGYPDDAVLGMGLALDEAIANGFDHGTKGDPGKHVRVAYHVTARRAFAEVEDDGEGFAPGKVADPLAAENLDRPDGRGLLLMRELSTWVRHSRRGNRVVLCKEFPRG